MKNRTLATVLGLCAVAIACQRGLSPTAPTQKAASKAAAPSSAVTVASDDLYISEEDRKWWKQHVPHFAVDGLTVSVSGTNPWDHPVQQGHARQFWLKVFDKTKVPQDFIGQAGPFTIDAKGSFSASVDLGYGYCFVEAELRLDTADNHANGGDPHMLFGAADLDIPGCKRPKPNPTPEPTCDEDQTERPCPEPTPTPEPCDEDFLASSEPNPCPTPSPSPTPEPGFCYYRVSCGQQEEISAHNGNDCGEEEQSEICEGEGGIWLNFGEQSLQNHCRFSEPGLSNDDFQLTPGKSAEGCLDKKDD